MGTWATAFRKPQTVLGTIFWPLLTLGRLLLVALEPRGVTGCHCKGRAALRVPVASDKSVTFSAFWFFFKPMRRVGINLTLADEEDDSIKLHLSVPYLFDFFFTLSLQGIEMPKSWFGTDGVYCWKIVFYCCRYLAIKMHYRKTPLGHTGVFWQWERDKDRPHEYKIESAGQMRGKVHVQHTRHHGGYTITAVVKSEYVIPLSRQGLAQNDQKVTRYTVTTNDNLWTLQLDPKGVSFPKVVEAPESAREFVTTVANTPAEALKMYADYLQSLLV